eukprot:Sspe_Gene.55299::Locus_30422_Transcript_1_1_Confidence_1.000_Length_3744::g.55299::m.55299
MEASDEELADLLDQPVQSVADMARYQLQAKVQENMRLHKEMHKEKDRLRRLVKENKQLSQRLKETAEELSMTRRQMFMGQHAERWEEIRRDGAKKGAKQVEARSYDTTAKGDGHNLRTMLSSFVDTKGISVVQWVLNVLSDLLDAAAVRAEVARWSTLRTQTLTAPPSYYEDGVGHPTRPMDHTPHKVGDHHTGGVWEAVRSLGNWRTPQGVCWPGQETQDVLRDCAYVAAHHPTGQPREVVAPLFVYTCLVNHRSVWAVWVSEKGWCVLEATEGVEKEYSVRTFQNEDVVVPHQLGQCMAEKLGVGVLSVPATLEVQTIFAFGLTLLRRGDVVVARYVNSSRGESAISPLMDTVAWLPPPASLAGDVFTFDNDPQKSLPPPGILEYVATRLPTECLGMEGVWSTSPYPTPPPALALEASPNPLAVPVDDLLREVTEADPVYSNVMRVLLTHHKWPIHGFPNPLTMQELTWHGRRLLVALHGKANAMADLATDAATPLYRVSHESIFQPFRIISTFMRNMGCGARDTYLEVDKGDGALAGRYCPTEYPPSSPDGRSAVPRVTLQKGGALGAVEMQRTTQPFHTAVWTGAAWLVHTIGGEVMSPSCAPRYVEGTWMEGQVRHILHFLARAVSGLRPAPSTVYRSSSSLPDGHLYTPHNVVCWASYSIANENPGLVSSPSTEVVFRCLGLSCVRIASWSRFPRRGDCLFPSPSIFQVTEISEAKGSCVLTEVSHVQALAVFVRSTLPDCKSTGSVLDRLRIAEVLEKGDLNAAMDALLHPDDDSPLIHGPQGIALAKHLLALGVPRRKLDAALHEAAAGGTVETAKGVIACGADPTSVDPETGRSTLQVAAWALNLPVLGYLARVVGPPKPSDFSPDALHTACHMGMVDAVGPLVAEHGMRGKIEEYREGMLPIHRAVVSPAFDTPEGAVALRILITPTTLHAPSNQQSPLHLAAAGGHATTVRTLLQCGADPNKRGAEGLTPLQTAAGLLRLPVIELLRPVTATPLSIADLPVASLHTAASHGCLDTVDLLLDMGVDPNLPSERLGTPAGRLAVLGGVATGTLPVHIAAGVAEFNDSERGLDLLRRLATPQAVETRTPSGSTALHKAAFHGMAQACRVLLDCGADPNIEEPGEHRHRTPLAVAVGQGHVQAVTVLLPVTSPDKLTDEVCAQARSLAQWSGTVQILRNSAEVKRACDAFVAAAAVGEVHVDTWVRRATWNTTKADCCGRSGTVALMRYGVLVVDFGDGIR